MLSEVQNQRYLRNTILPEIGILGQEKLLKSKVLIIGAGGLGSPAILYLAAAGVGNITVIDDDVVELSNLQRQIIHNFKDLGKAKVVSAKEKILALNEDVKMEIHQIRVDLENLRPIAAEHDLVLDCSDNFYTRFIINEVCFREKKPLIFAAVKGFLGQLTVFKSYQKDSPQGNPQGNPCYQCFNPNIVDKNFSLPLSEKGILGAVAGTFGALQANTAIKEILGIGQEIKNSLVGKMLIADLLQNNIRKVSLQKNPNCKLCSS